ncbi:FecR domain-containing protein [candidate division KSB1 bacterium]
MNIRSNPWNITAVPALLLALVVWVPPTASLAADGSDVAIVFKTKGRIDARKAAQNRWIEQVGIGFRLDSEDRIKALDKSMAAIMFTDDRSLIKVQANTELEIQGERQADNINKKVELDLGGMFFNIAPQDKPFEIVTPTSVASVKGSVGFIEYSPGGSTVLSMLSGLVVMFSTATGDSVSVGNGQTGEVSEGGNTAVAKTTTEASAVIRAETGDMLVPTIQADQSRKEIIIEFRDDQGNIRRVRIPYSDNQ